MSALRDDLATVTVLWRRDLRVFFRERSRLAGALAQPLLFWLAIGSGMAPTFRLQDGGQGYMGYFFPGIVLMLVLFSAISSTMSLIDDRHRGFLQGVLAGPGSRAALVLGKALGSTTIALLQSAILLAAAPFAGLPLAGVSWVPLAAALALTSLGLSGIGLAIAWRLDSTQGYHVVMSVVLIPLWVLSGAVFPAAGLNPVLGAIVRANPVSYAVAATRRALHGGTLPAGAGLPGSSELLEWAVVAGLAAAAVSAAAWVVSRRSQR
jgi:daunorubicin resistance ABC transporter membrane protein